MTSNSALVKLARTAVFEHYGLTKRAFPAHALGTGIGGGIGALAGGIAGYQSGRDGSTQDRVLGALGGGLLGGGIGAGAGYGASHAYHHLNTPAAAQAEASAAAAAPAAPAAAAPAAAAPAAAAPAAVAPAAVAAQSTPPAPPGPQGAPAAAVADLALQGGPEKPYYADAQAWKNDGIQKALHPRAEQAFNTGLIPNTSDAHSTASQFLGGDQASHADMLRAYPGGWQHELLTRLGPNVKAPGAAAAAPPPAAAVAELGLNPSHQAEAAVVQQNAIPEALAQAGQVGSSQVVPPPAKPRGRNLLLNPTETGIGRGAAAPPPAAAVAELGLNPSHQTEAAVIQQNAIPEALAQTGQSGSPQEVPPPPETRGRNLLLNPTETGIGRGASQPLASNQDLANLALADKAPPPASSYVPGGLADRLRTARASAPPQVQAPSSARTNRLREVLDRGRSKLVAQEKTRSALADLGLTVGNPPQMPESALPRPPAPPGPRGAPAAETTPTGTSNQDLANLALGKENTRSSLADLGLTGGNPQDQAPPSRDMLPSERINKIEEFRNSAIQNQLLDNIAPQTLAELATSVRPATPQGGNAPPAPPAPRAFTQAAPRGVDAPPAPPAPRRPPAPPASQLRNPTLEMIARQNAEAAAAPKAPPAPPRRNPAQEFIVKQEAEARAAQAQAQAQAQAEAEAEAQARYGF